MAVWPTHIFIIGSPYNLQKYKELYINSAHCVCVQFESYALDALNHY